MRFVLCSPRRGYPRVVGWRCQVRDVPCLLSREPRSDGAGVSVAIVSLYTLIHIPLDDQRELLSRIFVALRPGGLLLAIVGHEQWTGVEDYLGAPMFWEHADTDTKLAWLREDGFDVLWHRYVPEGDVGHTLLLAQRPETAGSYAT